MGGRWDAAIAATQPVIEFPLDDFSCLSTDGKQRLIMAARIHVGAGLSKASSAFRASTVARSLRPVKITIQDIYRHPEVQQAAQEIKTDILDRPRDFYTEMAMDELEYQGIVDDLIGPPAGLESTYDTAINRASKRIMLDFMIKDTEEPAMKTLIQFERIRLFYQDFSSSEENFQALKDNFKGAVQASIQAQYWERLATIASRYSVSVFRRIDCIEAVKGLSYWWRARKEDPATSSILWREITKGMTGSIRHTMWRKTASPGVDYSYLALAW